MNGWDLLVIGICTTLVLFSWIYGYANSEVTKFWPDSYYERAIHKVHRIMDEERERKNNSG